MPEPGVFWDRERAELLTEVADLRKRIAYLSSALDIATRGTNADDDLVARLVALVEQYAPADDPEVISALSDAG